MPCPKCKGRGIGCTFCGRKTQKPEIQVKLKDVAKKCHACRDTDLEYDFQKQEHVCPKCHARYTTLTHNLARELGGGEFKEAREIFREALSFEGNYGEIPDLGQKREPSYWHYPEERLPELVEVRCEGGKYSFKFDNGDEFDIAHESRFFTFAPPISVTSEDFREYAQKYFYDNGHEDDPISEDEDMGFGKSKLLPTRIEDLDFNKLQNFQVRALAHFMGVERLVMKGAANAQDRRDALKKYCLDTETSKKRAQEGYDAIIKGRSSSGATPGGGGTGGLGEERVKELIKERLDDGIDDIVNEHLDQVKWHTLAKDALKEASEQYRPIAIKMPDGKMNKVKGVLPPEFKKMVELASQRIPIMLVGPAGCGKTYLCEKLGEALGMEFSDQSCSEGMSESVFNGLLLPIGKNGEFKHVSSPFMDRYESGGVMLLDEIDAGDPNLFTYINKAIANKSYTVAQRYLKPQVKKHKDFVLIAAANTFGNGADAMYVGRNQLDAATVDRFKVGLITLDYNKDVELSLADKALCEWAWKVRANIAKHKLRRIMSTRVINDMGLMNKAYDWGIEQWNESYFTGWPPNEVRLALEGGV